MTWCNYSEVLPAIPQVWRPSRAMAGETIGKAGKPGCRLEAERFGSQLPMLIARRCPVVDLHPTAWRIIFYLILKKRVEPLALSVIKFYGARQGAQNKVEKVSSCLTMPAQTSPR
jgi:hypothetical protein